MINGADRDRPYTTCPSCGTVLVSAEGRNREVEAFGIGDMIHYGRYIGIITFGEYDNHQNSFHIGFYVNWINDKTESLRQDLGYWIRRKGVQHEQQNHGEQSQISKN